MGASEAVSFQAHPWRKHFVKISFTSRPCLLKHIVRNMFTLCISIRAYGQPDMLAHKHMHGNGHMDMTTFVCLCVARVHAWMPPSFYFSFFESMERTPNRMRPKSGAMQGVVCACAWVAQLHEVPLFDPDKLYGVLYGGIQRVYLRVFMHHKGLSMAFHRVHCVHPAPEMHGPEFIPGQWMTDMKSLHVYMWNHVNSCNYIIKTYTPGLVSLMALQAWVCRPDPFLGYVHLCLSFPCVRKYTDTELQAVTEARWINCINCKRLGIRGWTKNKHNCFAPIIDPMRSNAPDVNNIWNDDLRDCSEPGNVSRRGPPFQLHMGCTLQMAISCNSMGKMMIEHQCAGTTKYQVPCFQTNPCHGPCLN